MLIRRWIFIVITSIAALSGSLNSHANYSEDKRLKSLEERIKPVGQVRVDDKDAQQATSTKAQKGASRGKEIYQDKCFACHGAGIAGAPKLGDKKSWDMRMKKGMQKVLEIVIAGTATGMPPKGTCMDCSEADLRATINFMMSAKK